MGLRASWSSERYSCLYQGHWDYMIFMAPSRILLSSFSEKCCAHSLAVAKAKGCSRCFQAADGLVSQSGFSNGHAVFSWGSPVQWGHGIGIEMVETFQKKQEFLGHLTLAQHLSPVCSAERQFRIFFTSSEVPNWIILHNMVGMRCNKAESLNCVALLVWC